ncbi:MAG: hypothetical protein SFU21_04275 [Flavihumibacter sp.]|nr:hypothetical protein [Flavihumibacter sp.]
MKKIIVLVLLVTAQQAYSQCEPVSLFNLDLFITQGGGGLKYVKFAFTKIAEDSAEVTFANCKWDSTGKCYAYKEYAIASKKNERYWRYACFERAQYEKLKSEILAKSEKKEQGTATYYMYDKKMLVNFIEQDLPANACGLKQQYFIEFLRQ